MTLAEIAKQLAKLKAASASPQVVAALTVARKVAGFLALERLRANFRKWNREGKPK